MASWARKHPINAVVRGLWILFNAAAAAGGGGVLFYGPLEAGWPVVILAGSVVGLFVGWLWFRQQAAAIAGEMETARRWKRGLLTGQLVVISILALVSIFQLYEVGAFPSTTQNRTANFERLWQAMDKQYPYFEQKNVDWEAVYDRYKPQVATVETDDEYFDLIASMLAELNDAHTDLLQPSPTSGRHYFATGKLFDDGIIVDEVGRIALQAGVERGMQVLEVDGLPVEEVLAALPAPLWSGSTSWQRQNSAAFHVLSTTKEELQLTLADSSGEPQRVTLVWSEGTSTKSTANQEDTGPQITGEVLPSGFGLIRIPTFGSGRNDLVAEFDEAMDNLMETPGLILDVRGNGGGSTLISDKIAGRFFSEPFTYGQDVFRQRLPFRAWSLRWKYRVKPHGQTYKGPVVLLIDAGNMSTTEQFIAALVDSGRAQAVGRRTGGSSGNPTTFQLTGGGVARFSTGAFYRLDGTLIEGAGIIPDVVVPYTLEDYRAGIDPDLEAAEMMLSGYDG